MKKLGAFLSLLFLYLVFGIFIAKQDLNVLSQSGPDVFEFKDFYDYSGVLNVHSTKSTGGASVPSIIKAASDAELDFIIFNEDRALNQKQPQAIKYGKLNVLYGFEQNFKGSDFLYVETENKELFESHSHMQLFLEDIYENGSEQGLFILAHPDKKGFQWKGAPGSISGMEVLNLREVWRQAWQKNKVVFLGALLFYPFSPELFFTTLYSDDFLSLGTWSAWNTKGKITYGYVGSDVTSKLRLYEGKHLNFPGYKTIFSVARNHVVLRDELTGLGDPQRILQALKKGQSYFSLDVFGDPSGFNFFAKSAGQTALMGQKLNRVSGQPAELHVHLPKVHRPVKVELLKNGRVHGIFPGAFSYQISESGFYQILVRAKVSRHLFRHQKWVPWVVSNPIYVTGPP